MRSADWTINERALKGVLYSVGLGFFAGGIETVVVASREAFALGGLQMVGLGLVAMLVMGLFTGLLSAVVALPLQFVLRSARPSTAVALQQAVVGFLLIGFYLWQVAWLVYTDERAPGAAALAAMPIGFAGVIYFNARFLLRRLEIGKPFGTPWLPTSFAGGLAFVLLGAGLFAFRDTGGTHALPDDQNFLLVTVGGWHHGTQGVPGAHFTNAVTPAPAVRPAAVTLQTGIHPLRTRVIDDDDALAWNYRTLAEVLVVEGYATGAFVGVPELAADSGLDQGFLVYSDEMFVNGLLHLNLPGHLFRSWRQPRSDQAVVAEVESWLGAKRDLPFYAWVHLQDGDPATLEALLQLFEPLRDETMIAVVGTHGDGTGLSEEAIRVPLFLHVPGKPAPTIVTQVRLMDVPQAALSFLGMEGPQTEGIDLGGYLTGDRTASLGITVVGHDEAGTPMLAVRNNGMKFYERPDGTEALYNVDQDPTEQHELSATATTSLEQARRLLAADSIRLEKLLEESR